MRVLYQANNLSIRPDSDEAERNKQRQAERQARINQETEINREEMDSSQCSQYNSI